MVVINSHISQYSRPLRNCRGFTLIELLMVMAIVAILATMALAGIDNFRNQTKISRAAAEIRGIEKDIISFASERGIFPASLADIGWDTRPDPWGSAYVYVVLPAVLPNENRTYFGVPLNSDFDLYSLGIDKTTTLPSIVGNDDDIIRATDGSFVGTVEKFAL